MYIHCFRHVTVEKRAVVLLALDISANGKR